MALLDFTFPTCLYPVARWPQNPTFSLHKALGNVDTGINTIMEISLETLLECAFLQVFQHPPASYFSIGKNSLGTNLG